MEGAIHVVCELFDQHCDDGWGFCLLMLEMLSTLLTVWWNARVVWPRCSCFLFNTYQGYAKLFVHGSD